MKERAVQHEAYYFERPEIWDEVNRERFLREPAFIAEVFAKYGSVRDVLDVGCGTGGHLEQLQKLGFRGHGVDLNPRMVAFAKARHPQLSFDVGDMQELSYVDRFDAITCLCTTFCYNTENDNVVRTLGNFRSALRANGLLLIETFNPICFLDSIKFEKRLEQSEGYERLGLRCVTLHEIDSAKQLFVERRTISELATGKELRTDLSRFRMFFPQEMRYFLETCGFRLLSFFGAHNVDDIEPSRFRLITLARRVE